MCFAKGSTLDDYKHPDWSQTLTDNCVLSLRW